MTLLIKITLVAALILSIIIPFGSFLLGKKTDIKNPSHLTVSSSLVLC